MSAYKNGSDFFVLEFIPKIIISTASQLIPYSPRGISFFVLFLYYFQRMRGHVESEIHLPQPRQEDKEDTANNLLRKSWLSSITASMSSLYQWSGAQVVRKSENSVSEAKSKVSSKSAVKTEAFNIFPNSQVTLVKILEMTLKEFNHPKG